MKNISKKTKILAFLIVIIIVIGIGITATIGLNFDLERNFEINDIKEITNQVLPSQNVIIQKVEVYEDTVSILAKEITEEQKVEIINKINEKYATTLSTETEISNVPHTRGRDIVKPYIIPFLIATDISIYGNKIL